MRWFKITYNSSVWAVKAHNPQEASQRWHHFYGYLHQLEGVAVKLISEEEANSFNSYSKIV